MYLFVYGTLKKGFHNHHTIRDAEYCDDFFLPSYDMYSLGGFPGIVPGTGTVHGEVFEITEDHLPRLDRLEGVPHMYRREIVTVFRENSFLKPDAYIWNMDYTGLPKIEDGIWRFGDTSRWR